MHHNCDKLFTEIFGLNSWEFINQTVFFRKYAYLPAQIPATTVQTSQGHEIKASLTINCSLISTLRIAELKFNIWLMAEELKCFFLSLVILTEIL